MLNIKRASLHINTMYKINCTSVQDKKVQRALKCFPLVAQIEDDMAQVVKAIAEEGLESTLQRFFKGIGRCWWSHSPV